jgi:dCMP deaminase
VSRLHLKEYALQLAEVAAKRSEDPWTKVGAIALDKENRVIATAYNGLSAGMTVRHDFWQDRSGRKPFVIHAEMNLMSLVRRGEVAIVACTMSPCLACAQSMIAHGVIAVWYREEADDRHREALDVLRFHSVMTLQVPKFGLLP